MEVSPRQYLIVVRHGLRQDELDSRWAQQAQRPWDPPLAEAGNAQVVLLCLHTPDILVRNELAHFNALISFCWTI